jgi:hypothetical protein
MIQQRFRLPGWNYKIFSLLNNQPNKRINKVGLKKNTTLIVVQRKLLYHFFWYNIRLVSKSHYCTQYSCWREFWWNFFFIFVELVTTRASSIGIPRDIYRGWVQIETNEPYCLRVSSQYFSHYVVSELLRSLIAFHLFLKRVEDVSEEACDADGVYVTLQDQRWRKDLKYFWSFTWE